jgi:acetyl esterase/lipase
MFTCVAEGPLANGFDAALIGYTLAPEATLMDIVGEARAAVRWLRGQAAGLGIVGGKLIVSGWSAGGHLASMVLGEASAGLAISGIFDLEPCRLNYLNEKLQLSLDEQSALSPIRQLPLSSPDLVIAFGTDELPELQRQSQDYDSARRTVGLPSDLLPLTGQDHFSILEELASPSGKLTARLVELARDQ